MVYTESGKCRINAEIIYIDENGNEKTEKINTNFMNDPTRVDTLVTKRLSKPDRVREIIRNTAGPLTKAQIMMQCPDVSQTTVARALTDLLKSGEIRKIGGGRYTSYAWNWEKE